MKKENGKERQGYTTERKTYKAVLARIGFKFNDWYHHRSQTDQEIWMEGDK